MNSGLPDLPEIGLEVKPKLIAGDICLHDDVEQRLPQRDSWHLSHGDANGLVHQLVVYLRVISESRPVDQLVQLGVLI